MASCPITSWQIDGETMETVTDFIFLGSRITADGDCTHEIKRRLLIGRKTMTDLDSIFKGRDITLPTKVRLVKAMVFPVVMYGCESRTIKKKHFWCFWTMVLKKTLESPLDCKEIQPVHLKGNQSWIIIGRTDQFSSIVTLSCPTPCDLMDRGTPGLPVHHQLLEFTHIHVHRVGDAIQTSHPLSSPSPPTFNLSQHQGLFKWVSSLHQVAKVLEFQLPHQSFQWIFRTDFL